MFTMRHALIATLAAGAVACGGAADDPDPGVTASIGPAGGTVSHPDGVTLVVPEGALTTTQSITITSGGSSLAGTRMYSFEPAGLAFVASKIVTVSFPFDPVAAGTTNAAVYWSEPGTTTYDVLPATVAGTKASTRVMNLSWGHVGGPCTAGASCHPSECELGVGTCSAGAPLCAEPVVVADLTACTAGVCRAGLCVAECNAVSVEGAPVFDAVLVSTLVTPVPVAAGGTVQPGTYFRTAVNVYGTGEGTAPEYEQGVWVISGNTVQGAYAAAVGIDRWTASLALAGTSLAIDGTCGFTETLTYGYTATATELKLYFPDNDGNIFEYVLTKQ
jgi:hypothetical protein